MADQRDRPSVGGYVANVRDITERKEFEALLAHRALHDPLTGLANRQLILDRAEQMLARSRRTCDPVAAFFIDLDNFKDANDSLGHEAGDKLLQTVARPVRRSAAGQRHRGSAGWGRVRDPGRGQLRSPPDPRWWPNGSARCCASRSWSTGSRACPSPSPPVSGSPPATVPSAQELLRDADIALYRTKAAGRDGWVLFEPAMQSAAIDRLELKSDLDSALADDQFFLLYQPIFDLDSASIRGVEALIRWQHPTRGVIAPNDFIPVLEDSGMIVEVGRWVLETACAQAASWHAQGLRHHDVGQRVHAPAGDRAVHRARGGGAGVQQPRSELPDHRGHRVDARCGTPTPRCPV